MKRTLWAAAALLVLHWSTPGPALDAIAPDDGRSASVRTVEHAHPFVFPKSERPAVGKPRPAQKTERFSPEPEMAGLASPLGWAGPYRSPDLRLADGRQMVPSPRRAFDARGPPFRG